MIWRLLLHKSFTFENDLQVKGTKHKVFLDEIILEVSYFKSSGRDQLPETVRIPS